MFKKALFSIILSVCFGLTFSSCTKTKDPVFVEPYIIHGITDLQWKKNAFGFGGGTMMLTMEYLNSKQEYLTLSLEGLPAGIGYTITPSSGYAPFSSTIMLSDTASAAGTYTVQLKVKGATTGEKTYNINLTILASPSIFDGIIGLYSNASSSCFGFGSTNTHTVSRKSPTSNTIVINNFLNTGTDLDVIVSAPMGNLTIDKQNITYNGMTWEVQGNGYLMYNPATSEVTGLYLSLNMKDPTNNSTFSCSTNIYR